MNTQGGVVKGRKDRDLFFVVAGAFCSITVGTILLEGEERKCRRRNKKRKHNPKYQIHHSSYQVNHLKYQTHHSKSYVHQPKYVHQIKHPKYQIHNLNCQIHHPNTKQGTLIKLQGSNKRGETRKWELGYFIFGEKY